MDLNELIKKIVPYYNQYKKNQVNLSGTEALEIIWEVGELLKEYLSDKDIAPRTLYGQIYGKSEAAINIAQKSYITRDFLDRAYRVRRIFTNKSDIKRVFPGLKRYRLFYKAMPFYDEGKFKLDEKDLSKLTRLLNSNLSYKNIMSEVFKLQNEKIKLKIPKDSKLKELGNDREIFINFYNHLRNIILEKNWENAKVDMLNNKDFILSLSRNVGALVRDDLKFTELQAPNKLNKDWVAFTALIIRLISRKDAIIRRRLRRLIQPEKMLRLSEMIYALVDENTFKKYRLS